VGLAELPAELQVPPEVHGDGLGWLEARRAHRIRAGMSEKLANGRWIVEAQWVIARKQAAARGEAFVEPLP
jgi:hypothetical protein